MHPSALHPSLIIVGGASLDILHFAGRTARAAGGAGLYTALAAQRMGVATTMIAPRPSPMPDQLQAASEQITWVGPQVTPADLPTFEIAHYGGGRTKMLNYWWRSEAALELRHIPAELPNGLAYVIPLAEPQRQIEFLQHFKAQGRVVSCGTYYHAVRDFGGLVRQAMDLADIFFCNETEARGLFGAPENARTATGKLLFVTLGPGGALVMQGAYQTFVPGVAVEELDPTGAGDTFCGTTLALLARGWHPVMAARYACATAAQTVTAVGPAALLHEPPPFPDDARTAPDEAQIIHIAELVREVDEVCAFAFTGPDFPAVGDKRALEFFFAATLQQFGFWTDDGTRYVAPMYGRVGGRELKGSDYLWAIYRNAECGVRSADSSSAECGVRSADLPEGAEVLPDFAGRTGLTQSYGRDLEALGLTPTEIVRRANASEKPLQAFLSYLDHIGGYKEDPLRKKSALLALILQQRPEKFLRDAGETVPPIVDYHIQRSCLRTGLVKINDAGLRAKLAARLLLQPDEEWAARWAAYRAMVLLQEVSGCTTGALDKFFFDNRRRCPEMSVPDCAACPLDAVCGQRKELFQPVLRTTFY